MRVLIFFFYLTLAEKTNRQKSKKLNQIKSLLFIYCFVYVFSNVLSFFPSHFVVFCFSEPPYLSHSHSKDDFLSGIYVIPQIEGEKDKAVHGVTFIPLILHPSQYKYSTV